MTKLKCINVDGKIKSSWVKTEKMNFDFQDPPDSFKERQNKRLSKR